MANGVHVWGVAGGGAAVPPPPTANNLLLAHPGPAGALAASRQHQQRVANAAVAGVGGVIYIDEVEAKTMHRPRNHYNIKALDGINNAMLQATRMISQAIGWAHQPPAAAGFAPPFPNAAARPLPGGDGDIIVSLYARLVSTWAANRADAVVQYERMIDCLERKEEEELEAHLLNHNLHELPLSSAAPSPYVAATATAAAAPPQTSPLPPPPLPTSHRRRQRCRCHCCQRLTLYEYKIIYYYFTIFHRRRCCRYRHRRRPTAAAAIAAAADVLHNTNIKYNIIILQSQIITKHGGTKPKGVITSRYVTIYADVAVGEKGTHTQLLNGISIRPFICGFVAIPCLANAEKVAHHCVVFLHGDVCGPHRSVAPLLRIGQLRTSRKNAVITLDTMMSQVEGTISKGSKRGPLPWRGRRTVLAGSWPQCRRRHVVQTQDQKGCRAHSGERLSQP